ncbi:molybdopterin molybdotransferase MoeA [Clostridiaceae bacterium UIB06]|uniref:Molybdopterin molybdenumtransferase n=1 Tax=Clostridium thailandense TaxID=2794346 RepID=A0A949TTH2_9CLOT|nr:gephyrin-like molybdotransferase Glp [Clostridium thailandense]MBV7273086.1 molybdopterin molybdotransferase MoeA [Clostridium thailandense]MCH5135750.1 molybdopterin molybdotransferase MoeA [Clostridiaceae bacterium UIB06]
MVDVDNALNIIYENTKEADLEKKDILSCLNKVLAENIYSQDNLPPFDKSAMDGYAIKSEYTRGCGTEKSVKLEIRGIIRAGYYCEDELEVGQAFKIMTGAPLPKGADAVIEIEKVKVEGNILIISEEVDKGNNVIKLGEEIKVGELALTKGSNIRPVEIGLLASLGYSSIKVYKSPTVALIITGDELVDIDSELEKGKIRNSNEYSLKALIKNSGAEALSLGVVSDDKDNLKEKVKYALENADIVITSGGASVGDYDFVDDVLKEIGADVKFTSVAIKPGKPITFATYKEKLFFALPGNPSSIITVFEGFVKPAIRKIMGKQEEDMEEFPVILAEDFEAKIGRRKYVYVEIKVDNGKYYAYKVGSQCSNHLMTMSRANGIVIIPEECGNVKVGDVLNGKFIFR